jgi:protein tyrosine/serine phosphatase
MPNRRRLVVVTLLILATAAGAQVRPVEWATPLVVPGVPNLYRVDAHVYRSAQPSAAGMRELEKLGIKTVLCLRDFHDDVDEARGTGLTLVRIELNAWHSDEAELARALRVLVDPAAWPVLVHCQHGADRTGLVSALYRITVQGWDRERAIDEMTRGGFGFHSLWKGIPRFVRKVDAEGIRRQLGLSGAPEPAAASPTPR